MKPIKLEWILLLFVCFIFDLIKMIPAIIIIAKDGWKAWWTSGWAMVSYVVVGLLFLVLAVTLLICWIQEKRKKYSDLPLLPEDLDPIHKESETDAEVNSCMNRSGYQSIRVIDQCKGGFNQELIINGRRDVNDTASFEDAQSSL
ncbi:MAG: hypothetical protein MJZ07_01995 [Bacteroidales bacterium]|nr:hypothetical protein [Bacteroidales bacterium]